MVTPNSETEMPTDSGMNKAEVPGTENESLFIKWWLDRLKSTEKFHEPDFKRMRWSGRFARGYQWDGQKNVRADKYVVNIVQSEIASSVATLYAKNPTFITKRAPKMDFEIWDEDPESYQEALMTLQTQPGFSAAAIPALALIRDVEQGKARRALFERVAKTLKIVLDQQIKQQQPNFKRQMKKLVRRVETHGVGFGKLGYQRIGDLHPEHASRINDFAARIATIERLAENVTDEESEIYNRQIEELRVSMKSLQESDTVVIREGLTVFFPKAFDVLVDIACVELEGFVGARFVAERYRLTADQIKEIYKKEVKTKATSYQRSATGEHKDGSHKLRRKEDGENTDYDDLYTVYEVYSSELGVTFTICEGFDEYLREPKAPTVTLERFYPYYPITFNDIEDDTSLYPPTTVEMVEHVQKEINRAKEMLRQHRIASKPQYAGVDGSFDEEDMNNLSNLPEHAVLLLKALQPGQKVEDLLQQIKKYPIDPNVYETSSFMDDMRKITRRPEAGLGGRSNATATADSIAADTRQTEDRSKADDIDDFITALATDASTILMMEMPAEEVKRIAGRGAAWPQTDPLDLLNDLDIYVEAGSSGRPNRALEVSTLQRLFPLLIQTPGIKPGWLARQGIKLADSSVDLTEAYLDGMPSIQALNAAANTPQVGTGNPETDPNQQGARGADPTPNPDKPDDSLTINQGLNQISGPET